VLAITSGTISTSFHDGDGVVKNLLAITGLEASAFVGHRENTNVVLAITYRNHSVVIPDDEEFGKLLEITRTEFGTHDRTYRNQRFVSNNTPEFTHQQ
jgi:hypothetical protein